MKTQKANLNTESALIELHDPDGAKKVRKLLDRMEVRREDDTPEEAAIRLSAMALMLSNIAAPHLVAKVGDCEVDLGVGFGVEGGFLSSDIEAAVVEPVFRIQQLWERNLLHDVYVDTQGRQRYEGVPKKDSPDYYDCMLLPGPRARRMIPHMQKKHVEETAKKNQALGSRDNPTAARAETVTAHDRCSDQMIMRNRGETRHRELLDYRVFIANGTTASGLEKRATQAHLGRFIMQVRIDSPEHLERIGNIFADYARHRNIRRGNATLMLRADPVVTVGTNVLSQVAVPGRHHPQFMTRLLWLVESSAGCDLMCGVKSNEEFKSPTLNFQMSCEAEVGRRINFTNTHTHDLPGLERHLAEWRKFLREREQKFPGIASAVENLPVALCYGLESLWMHRIQMDGAEVLALAKWLVIRMCNRFAVAAIDGQTAQTKQLAAKISGKLLEHGPLTVRDLTRKCSRLKAGDCRNALQWLEGRRIVGCERNHWGIIADTEVVRELLR